MFKLGLGGRKFNICLNKKLLSGHIDLPELTYLKSTDSNIGINLIRETAEYIATNIKFYDSATQEETKNVPSNMYAQRRLKSACASAQSD